MKSDLYHNSDGVRDPSPAGAAKREEQTSVRTGQ